MAYSTWFLDLHHLSFIAAAVLIIQAMLVSEVLKGRQLDS